MRPLIFAAPMLALATACSGGTPIAPGYWETTTNLSAGQTELWSSTVSRCIEAAEAAEPGAAFLSTSPLGPCQATENNHSGGALTVRAHCMGRGGAGSMDQTLVTLEGSYASDRVDAQVSAEPVMRPDGPPLRGRTTARRTGDCPI